jgi:predicted regulator of Ras-like GTPase activity (Roadblock/LC7/MglB family)
MGNTARRLRFIQDDLARVVTTLSALAESSGAKATVLFHKDGKLLASYGALEITNHDSISSAVAAAWGQLERLSQALGGGEPPFVLVPMGKRQLRLSPLGFRFLLGIVCDDQATIGSFSDPIQLASSRLNELFDEIDRRIDLANKAPQDPNSMPPPPQSSDPA